MSFLIKEVLWGAKRVLETPKHSRWVPLTWVWIVWWFYKIRRGYWTTPCHLTYIFDPVPNRITRLFFIHVIFYLKLLIGWCCPCKVCATIHFLEMYENETFFFIREALKKYIYYFKSFSRCILSLFFFVKKLLLSKSRPIHMFFTKEM